MLISAASAHGSWPSMACSARIYIVVALSLVNALKAERDEVRLSLPLNVTAGSCHPFNKVDTHAYVCAQTAGCFQIAGASCCGFV
jgi:hypothetical protein